LTLSHLRGYKCLRIAGRSSDPLSLISSGEAGASPAPATNFYRVMIKPQYPNPERVEDIKLIHEAMETCGGDMTEAAKLLGLPRLKLHKMIHKCDDLRLRWKTSKTATALPDREEIETHRELVVQEQTVAVALQQEEMAFRKGLEGMGVNGTALETALAFQRFGGRHYTNSLKMIAGGLSDQFLALQVEFKKVTAELDAGGRELPIRNLETGIITDTWVTLTPIREKVLRDDRTRISEQMQRFSDRAHKAMYTQALIKHRVEGRFKAAKPRGYLQINVNGKATTESTDGHGE